DGMPARAVTVNAVTAAFRRYRIPNLVVDPVMFAKSGARLLKEDAVEVLKTRLLPLAEIVTPNIPEAEVLSGHAIADLEAMRDAARRILALGAKRVVIKGGHAEGPNVVDLYYDGERFEEFKAERVATKNTHGTGCTYSAALVAYP